MRRVFRRLYNKWLEIGEILHEVTMALTFLSFIPTVLFTLYYLLWDFDFYRAIAGAVVFRVMLKSNIDM